MKNKFEKNLGITLIALVVTIVVLLILSGVTISMLTGQNSILNKAGESNQKTEETQEKENLELAIMSSKMEDVSTLEISKNSLEKAVKSQFGEDKRFNITDNGDNSFTISFEDSNRIYYVDKSGEMKKNDDILKISTAGDLKIFRDDVNSGNSYEGKYVYLTNDIQLDINENWKPIGIAEQTMDMSSNSEMHKPFKGIFDGKGHSIKGININTNEKGQGLFGFAIGAQILNVTLENSSIIAGTASAGIVGYIRDSGSISNCINKTNVSGNMMIGGIAGYCSNSNIEYCQNIGNITGKSQYISGISGHAGPNTKIYRCINNGSVLGNTHSVGGIAGRISNNCQILESCNLKEISGINYIGGIAGAVENGVEINACYNIANIVGIVDQNSYDIGGIAGESTSSFNSVKNSYNIGNISGKSNTGLIIGYDKLNTVIFNCYTQNDAFTYMNLGSEYKLDIKNINRGYPILSWQ